MEVPIPRPSQNPWSMSCKEIAAVIRRLRRLAIAFQRTLTSTISGSTPSLLELVQLYDTCIPWPSSHHVTLPAQWRQPSVNWWRQASRPASQKSTTSGGVLLELLKGRPSSSDKACVPPRISLRHPVWNHPPIKRRGGLPQVSDLPAMVHAGRDPPFPP